VQRHRWQCRRVNDRERRCVDEVDPKPTGGTSTGVVVAGGPIAAIRVCQARIVMMIRFVQRFRATGSRPGGKSVEQEDLEEQCGDRCPGRDFASDPMAHPWLAPPAVAMRAKHLRCYQNFPVALTLVQCSTLASLATAINPEGRPSASPSLAWTAPRWHADYLKLCFARSYGAADPVGCAATPAQRRRRGSLRRPLSPIIAPISARVGGAELVGWNRRPWRRFCGSTICRYGQASPC